MASTYPGAVDTFANNTDGVDYATAADMNNVQNAIVTTQTELGVVKNITPTTANVTVVANAKYFADISGLTANRVFVLPVGAVGDVVELTITVGDPDYELLIKGTAGVTINGGVAAAEWSRLFIAGETVKLRATSVSNWQVVHDGRTQCKAQIENTDAQTIGTAAATAVTLDEAGDFDVGDMADIANDQVVIRRDGIYRIEAHALFTAITAARMFMRIKVGVTSTVNAENGSDSSIYATLNPDKTVNLSDGDLITAIIYQNTGGNHDTNIAVTPTSLTVTEILP